MAEKKEYTDSLLQKCLKIISQFVPMNIVVLWFYFKNCREERCYRRVSQFSLVLNVFTWHFLYNRKTFYLHLRCARRFLFYVGPYLRCIVTRFWVNSYNYTNYWEAQIISAVIMCSAMINEIIIVNECAYYCRNSLYRRMIF